MHLPIGLFGVERIPQLVLGFGQIGADLDQHLVLKVALSADHGADMRLDQRPLDGVQVELAGKHYQGQGARNAGRPLGKTRSDSERAGDFAKRCLFGIADLNTSAKQASSLRCCLGRLLTDLT